jgi:hypothetical protein
MRGSAWPSVGHHHRPVRFATGRFALPAIRDRLKDVLSRSVSGFHGTASSGRWEIVFRSRCERKGAHHGSDGLFGRRFE